MAVGRISGPLLKANLLRQGVDLAFETDLIYLKVTDDDSANHRVGIKTNDPSHTLTVNGITRTTNLIVDDLANIADISISGTTISTTEDTLYLTPAGAGTPVVYQNRLRVDDIDITGNVISTNSANTNLELRPNGTGAVEVFSNLNVNGNIHATGNIRADGSIQLGDANTDSIDFNADVASDIIPDADDTYKLGSLDKRWADLYTNNLFSDVIVTGDIIVDGINLNLTQGKIWYVAQNGSDSYTGNHQNDPFRSLSHSLTRAQAGDTVYLYPGVYVESFPLTIPSGVTVKGAGIRAVKIVPTELTNDKDAFLLNGETTVEDLTVADFYYNSVDNTGHAFRFAENFAATSRSPYIRNITVITQGTTTTPLDPRGFSSGDAGRGAYLDGAIVAANSKEASCLFHSVTFITPGVDCIVTTNGTRIEWLNSFTYFANRSFYAVSGSTGFAGAGKTEIRIAGATGSFAVGDVLTYYSTFPTALASGTISKVDSDGKIYLSGKIEGLETQFTRGGKTIQAFGDAKLSTSVKKFGTASLALDGNGDYAFVQSNDDFAFGTGDFTVEGWVYRETTGVAVSLFDFRTAATQTAPWLYIGAGGSLLYVVNSSNRISTGSGTIGAGSWFHIALSRSGTDTRLFVNGTQVGSTYTDTNNYIQSPLTIGARYTGANEFFNGYIDDVRISKGVARYTSNFTAPTSTLVNDSNTSLLARFNGEDESTVLTDEVLLPQDIRTNAGGIASAITLLDYSDFGTEIRAIGSAAIYGNYGVHGDGLGVIAYLIGQNLAYIGVGYRVDNDPTYVIQANEIVELNGAKIYYSSVDHKGDFRVGDLFYVNQETGSVEFTTANFNIVSQNGVTFSDGVNTTYIDGTRIDTGNLRLSGNTLSSLSGDIDIVAASDEINLSNNVNISGNLDVVGNVTIGGNITLGNEDTDTIQFVGGIVSDIVPDATETYSLGTTDKKWLNAYIGQSIIDQITINNNSIVNTVANNDLIIDATGTGKVVVTDTDVLINQNLTVDGLTTLANTNIVGNVDIVGNISQIGNTTITGSAEINTNLTVDGTAQFQNIKIDSNEIATTITNTDLRLIANGTGRIYIPSNNVLINQNLTVDGTISTATINNTGRITSDEFFNNNILISGNRIETTVVNSDLELIANGAGVIKIEEFDFGTNVISSNSSNDIVLQPGAGKSVVIDSDQSIVIPIGTTSERPSPAQAGMIRFNTSLSRYEGFDGADWIRLDSRVTDLDENTYITAELTPGANDNTIRFYNDGVLTADLTSSRLRAERVEVDNILIDGNTITPLTTNTDLAFNASGTGSVRIANFAIRNNVITNTVANSITTITQTGTGYFKIAGNNGFVVPTGDSIQRPTYAVLGMTRYNSQVKQLEIFNGISWDSAAGAGGGINGATAEDIAISIALILG
jgi:phage protein U